MTCKTVKQTAEYFGVTPPTVYNWVRDGELGCLRLPGGSIRIRTNDIEQFEVRQWCAPGSTNPTMSSSDITQASITFIGQRAENHDPRLQGREQNPMLKRSLTDGSLAEQKSSPQQNQQSSGS